MKVQQITALATLLLITGGNGGCGGGSEGTGAFTSGLAKSTPVGSLTLKDRQQLCQKFSDFEQSLLTPDLVCPFLGVQVGLEQARGQDLAASAVCELAVPICFDQFNSDQIIVPPSECPIKPRDLSTCKLPISVVEECINDEFKEITSVLQNISCNEADKIKSVDELLPQVPYTPACIRLSKECADDSALLN